MPLRRRSPRDWGNPAPLVQDPLEISLKAHFSAYTTLLKVRTDERGPAAPAACLTHGGHDVDRHRKEERRIALAVPTYRAVILTS